MLSRASGWSSRSSRRFDVVEQTSSSRRSAVRFEGCHAAIPCDAYFDSSVSRTIPRHAAGRCLARACATGVAELPPQAYFVGSAVFHYLGPAFAVLLFARVDVARRRLAADRQRGAGLRRLAPAVAAARAARPAGPAARSVAWGAVLAVMNCCFYEAIDRLPLGTVAAIEFLRSIVLAAAGARTRRNAAALALAVGGVYLLTDVRLAGEPLGLRVRLRQRRAVRALHRARPPRRATRRGRRHRRARGGDADRAGRRDADRRLRPLPGARRPGRARSPAIGVGITSSVIPYVCDQLAMARLRRATYALLVALLPATATVVGVVVLAQVPTLLQILGVGLVILGVAVHHDAEAPL